MLVNARGIVSWLHVVCLVRVIEEAIGSKTGCPSPLGMESRLIVDSQITASSSKIPFLPPNAARLHNTYRMSRTPRSFGAWCAAHTDQSQYLQIDLLVVKNITAISTQGTGIGGGHWVTKYSLSYSCDGRAWQQYKVKGASHVFQANNDTSSVVQNTLLSPVIGRVIRLFPTAWTAYGSICMRVELHGCNTSQDHCLGILKGVSKYEQELEKDSGTLYSTDVIVQTGNLELPLDEMTTDAFIQLCRPTVPPTPYWTKQSTVQTIIAAITRRTTRLTSITGTIHHTTLSTSAVTTTPSCTSALGMEAGMVSDSQITASSYKSRSFLPATGRLHYYYNYRSGRLSFGAWCSYDSDSQQYLQVDLLTPTTITAIATQGMTFPEGNWVKSYTLSYSCDGITWFVYEHQGNIKVFQGNTNSRRVVRQDLFTPFTTRMVRIRPVTWNSIGNICLRLELYGCNDSRVCTTGNRTDGSLTTTISPKEAIESGKKATKVPAANQTQEPFTQYTIRHAGSAENGPTTTFNNTSGTAKVKRKKIIIIYKELEDETPVSGSSHFVSRPICIILFVILAMLY